MIANELVANATQHGVTPIDVTLRRDEVEVTLRVTDQGGSVDRDSGLGLTLVRQFATQGLGGTFELATHDGETVATLRFNVDEDADPDRRGRPRDRHRPDRPAEGARP